MNDFILTGQQNDTLVTGKNSMIFATVQSAGTFGLDPNTSITVTATLPDGSHATGKVKLGDAVQNDGMHNIAVIGPFSAETSGTITITASGPAPVPSSMPATINVTVKDTNPLAISYIPISGYFGDVSNDPGGTLVQHQKMSDSFMQGAFPVAEGELTSRLSNTALTGTSTTDKIFDLVEDLLQTLLAGTLLNPLARNAVGIVPTDYFPAHTVTPGVPGMDFTDSRGITYSSANGKNPAPVSLVTDGYWNVTAHEVGHTFGLDDLKSPGPVSGYWIDSSLSMNGSDDLMDGLAARFQFLRSTWISSAEYQSIFQQLLTDPTDPQVLVVSGTVSSSGSISLQPLYYLPNGAATPFDITMPGTVTAIGNFTLSEASFNAGFNLVDDKGDIISSGLGIFLVQLPFVNGLTTLKINYNGQTVAINPNSQLISDAIKSIPDQGFDQNPIQRRSALLNKVNALEQILANGTTEAAVNKLQNDIRKSISDWVLNSYQVSSPMQLQKTQVLATIDLVIKNLQSK